MAKSIISNEKKCYKCGNPSVHKHHIYFGGKRKISEKWGCWVYLCPRHHNASNEGIHYNHKFDLELKQICQIEFEKLYGHDKYMEVFRKNYV